MARNTKSSLLTVATPAAAIPGAEYFELYQECLADFRTSAQSVSDIFGLLRSDSPELPRYLLTLAALAAERRSRPAADRMCDVGGYYGIVATAATRLGYRAHLVD